MLPKGPAQINPYKGLLEMSECISAKEDSTSHPTIDSISTSPLLERLPKCYVHYHVEKHTRYIIGISGLGQTLSEVNHKFELRNVYVTGTDFMATNRKQGALMRIVLDYDELTILLFNDVYRILVVIRGVLSLRLKKPVSVLVTNLVKLQSVQVIVNLLCLLLTV